MQGTTLSTFMLHEINSLTVHNSTEYLHFCETLASLFTVDDVSALLPMLRAHSVSETLAVTRHLYYRPQVEEFRAFIRSHKTEPNAISAYIEELKARLTTIEKVSGGSVNPCAIDTSTFCQSIGELDRWFTRTRGNRTDELGELRERRREQQVLTTLPPA